MNLGITGKTALVLGGGGGLGRAISKALASEGVNIAIPDIAPDAIAGTQAAVGAFGVRSIGIIWDLGELPQIDAHVSKIESELAMIDILVNLTGGPPPTPAGGQEVAGRNS